MKKLAELKAQLDEAEKKQVGKDQIDALNAKIADQQKKIDDLNEQTKEQREAIIALGRPKKGSEEKNAEYHKNFVGYLKSGKYSDQLQEATEENGGYLVSPDIESGIDADIADQSAILQIADVRSTTKDIVKIHARISGAAAGWVGETDERPKTDTPTYDDVEIKLGTVYANPEVTNELLQDSDEDVEAEVSATVGDAMSEKVGDKLVNGDGTIGPKGILAYTQNVITKRSGIVWGKLNVVKTGVSGALATAPLSTFVQAKTILKPSYRKNAVWVWNSTTSAAVQNLVDANGRPLWQPGLTEDAPDRFLGIEVMEDENMPDIGADAVFALLITKKKAYAVRNHASGMYMLRDALTHKGFTNFYTSKRMGGGIRNFWALVGMKASA